MHWLNRFLNPGGWSVVKKNSSKMKNCATNERPQAQTTIGVIWEVTTTHQLNSKIFADVRLNIYNLSLDWLDWIYLVFFFRYFCWMRVNNLNLNLNNNVGQTNTFTFAIQDRSRFVGFDEGWIYQVQFDGRPPLFKQFFCEIFSTNHC